MTVNEFAKEVHENAVAHGWWETARSFPEVAALIHSEVSEALEEWRDGNPAIYGCCGIPGAVCEFEGACDKDEKTGTCKPEGVAVELCDAIIRILDYAVERGHGLRRRRSSSRWPLLLQGHYSRRSPLFQGRVSSACQGHSRQRQRGDKGLLYHVRHERDDLYRVPLQLWRMAHHERVHDGKRVYRVVRYKARQSGRLISARTGGERERLASRFGNWRVKA